MKSFLLNFSPQSTQHGRAAEVTEIYEIFSNPFLGVFSAFSALSVVNFLSPAQGSFGPGI